MSVRHIPINYTDPRATLYKTVDGRALNIPTCPTYPDHLSKSKLPYPESSQAAQLIPLVRPSLSTPSPDPSHEYETAAPLVTLLRISKVAVIAVPSN